MWFFTLLMFMGPQVNMGVQKTALIGLANLFDESPTCQWVVQDLDTPT